MQISSALRSAIRPALHGVFGHTSYPSGAIFHFDADIDPYAEQTGGPHTFNHAVLSPQYQRNADGSYTDVGARPAVDVFGGEKWLRSCGAVTNMLTNSVFAGAVSGTPGTAPTGWTLNNSTGSLSVSARELSFSVINQRHSVRQNFDLTANTSCNFSFLADCDGELSLLNILTLQNQIEGSSRYYVVDGTVQGPSYVPPMGLHLLELVYSIGSTAGIGYFVVGAGAATSATGTVTISNPQLTATSYPLPYVPTTTTGPVTQPASNATTTNGMWFSLPDGSPLWQALTGEPLTLATRVRMGVGSGGMPNGPADIVSCLPKVSGMQYYEKTSIGTEYIARAYDRSSVSGYSISSWPRNSIIRRITQVNTAGTQFRVGYMIEGTHTTIQWSAWVNYDGSMNPSTLYRLMLGYVNPYPQWYNKITAWKEEVSDARILEAMA